jgi:hypothetical protein
MLLAATAAFCVYFCMYAFRKPFTAATYEGQEFLSLGLKTTLVVSQLLGYMLSKFIGIKVVSEMGRNRRGIAIVATITAAELALVGVALLPLPMKVAMICINGLSLGMVFGLVLGYLEGRRHTEALSAALCASFIISSGFVKSVGAWLIQEFGVSDFSMPALTGLIFYPPMLISTWLLHNTPPPDQHDLELRNHRKAMTREDRRRFFHAYWPGLSLFVLVYVLTTIIRTIRDDFAVEIWRDMGIDREPSIFARSELWVAAVVTGLNALAILIKQNLTAIRLTIGLMCVAFGLIFVSTLLQSTGRISPFVFMVACGIGMYIPYVAFHTTLFERLVAASRHPGNLVFLMYVADAMGYLGYALVLIVRSSVRESAVILPFFRWTLMGIALGAVVALILAAAYFARVLTRETNTLLNQAESSTPLEPEAT